MAWKLLPVDYTDASWKGNKKFNQIDNDDGTVSFQDMTVYTNKDKSFFGAKDANRMNEALNTLMNMVENGTDLYEAFQNYFSEQKTDFENTANSTQTGYEDYVKNLKLTDNQTHADFNIYVDDLKKQGDETISTIKTDYRSEMDEYEDQQQAIFNAWFSAVQGKLTGDVATNLQNQINTLDTDRLGFGVRPVVFSADGKTVTETDGSNKIVTTFDSDTVITQKLYKSDVLTSTKTITFSADGLSVNEEVK